MVTLKTDVALSGLLLERIEAAARELNISRTLLYTMALEDFVRRYQNRRLLEQINQAYEDSPDSEEREWLEQVRQHHRRMVEGEW